MKTNSISLEKSVPALVKLGRANRQTKSSFQGSKVELVTQRPYDIAG